MWAVSAQHNIPTPPPRRRPDREKRTITDWRAFPTCCLARFGFLSHFGGEVMWEKRRLFSLFSESVSLSAIKV